MDLGRIVELTRRNIRDDLNDLSDEEVLFVLKCNVSNMKYLTGMSKQLFTAYMFTSRDAFEELYSFFKENIPIEYLEHYYRACIKFDRFPDLKISTKCGVPKSVFWELCEKYPCYIHYVDDPSEDLIKKCVEKYCLAVTCREPVTGKMVELALKSREVARKELPPQVFEEVNAEVQKLS